MITGIQSKEVLATSTDGMDSMLLSFYQQSVSDTSNLLVFRKRKFKKMIWTYALYAYFVCPEDFRSWTDAKADLADTT